MSTKTGISAETGSTLIPALLVGVLLSLLGGVAMNLAVTETTAEGRYLQETSSRVLAESGIEEVMAWFTQADLPMGVPIPLLFKGTTEHPDVDLDAGRSHDDHLLNDRRVGMFGALTEFGRIVRLRLYGSVRPEGLCTVEVTGESQGGVRRTVALELGALRIPAITAAIQAGPPSDLQDGDAWVLAHWGDIIMAGNPHLGRSDRFPRQSDSAEITGLGYDEPGVSQEDRWMNAWIGGEPQFADAPAVLPPNVHAKQDPLPGLPPSTWHYAKFKDLAKRFGSYYVPDREGRLYRNGNMDPAVAQTPSQVFGSLRAGDGKGLVFVDTVDQAPPSMDNLATLVVDAPYMEGVFYLAANVVLRPEGRGQAIPAWSPSTPGYEVSVGRVSVTIEDVNIQGVLNVAGRLSPQHQIRVFGAVVAEGGLNGEGLLEVWFDDDFRRGLFRGLPVVFPIPGTWREWGS